MPDCNEVHKGPLPRAGFFCFYKRMTSIPNSSALFCICRPGEPGGGTGMRVHRLLVSFFVTFLVTLAGMLLGCGGMDTPSNMATPDFTLGVSPATASVTGGAAGESVSV